MTQVATNKHLYIGEQKLGKGHLHIQLVKLLQLLAEQNYRFTTVTPLTHQRYLARHSAASENLQDIFGWNMPFSLEALSPALRRMMQEAEIFDTSFDALHRTDGESSSSLKAGSFLKSRVRVSSLADDLLLHSAFPTTASDAVFFGPDTYRFARFIRQTLIGLSMGQADIDRPLRVLDVGCGSGAGGMAVARALPWKPIDLTLNDINPVAMAYAQANMAAAAIDAQFLFGDIFNTPHGSFDLIISNPPYMMDSAGRAYRDGGERLGRDFSVRLVQHCIHHLAPGGRLLLYTGVAMTAHGDPFLEELLPLLATTNCQWTYEEIDPDVFGEELQQPAYGTACRIAAVGLVVTRST